MWPSLSLFKPPNDHSSKTKAPQSSACVCFHDNLPRIFVILRRKTIRAAPGIEPGTSRTLSENHTTRPSSRYLARNTAGDFDEI